MPPSGEGTEVKFYIVKKAFLDHKVGDKFELDPANAIVKTYVDGGWVEEAPAAVENDLIAKAIGNLNDSLKPVLEKDGRRRRLRGQQGPEARRPPDRRRALRGREAEVVRPSAHPDRDRVQRGVDPLQPRAGRRRAPEGLRIEVQPVGVEGGRADGRGLRPQRWLRRDARVLDRDLQDRDRGLDLRQQGPPPADDFQRAAVPQARPDRDRRRRLADRLPRRRRRRLGERDQAGQPDPGQAQARGCSRRASCSATRSCPTSCSRTTRSAWGR